ncbi:MAG TPA: quinone oxidoreductase [Gemmatimonadaceae bacterium]|nr:quinone oxidoreductase [Gemmatimonadaceae bacterium]
MHAVRVHEAGGAEALRYEEVPVPEPKAGEALVRLDAVGVNFIDVYKRMGRYPLPLPATLGEEGAGTVVAVGEGVRDVREGDRVAWASVLGAYAEYAVVPAARLVPLPDGVTAVQGAALMLQGMTAHYLASSTYPLREGDRCLVHAAAGGVGLLLVQIAKRRGAHVIGTAGSEEKAALARAAGADATIVYTRQDFAAETRRITGGARLDVVFDSVGQTTFLAGLDLLRPRGMMVLFGQSSGPVAPVDPQLLNRKGSLFLTRPTLRDYVATRDELLWRARELFEWVAAGTLSVRIGAEYPLAEAAEAHRALEGRRTTGKVLLRPG